VELVWFNMPLPKVVSEEEAATYEFMGDPVWESEEVQTAIETGIKLLTGAGVMVVVGPMGVPPLELVAAEVFPPLRPENKSTVTVVLEGKKTKVRGFGFSFLLVRMELPRTDCRYVRVDEKSSSNAQ
jgi:hypothetical protein